MCYKRSLFRLLTRGRCVLRHTYYVAWSPRVLLILSMPKYEGPSV